MGLIIAKIWPNGTYTTGVSFGRKKGYDATKGFKMPQDPITHKEVTYSEYVRLGTSDFLHRIRPGSIVACDGKLLVMVSRTKQLWKFQDWDIPLTACPLDGYFYALPSAISRKKITPPWCDLSEAPLGSSTLPNSHTSATVLSSSSQHGAVRAPRGSKGITTYGRRMVENAVYLIERSCPRHKISFGTLTLPDLNQDEQERIVANWSEITRVFFQWLKRKLEGCGLPAEIVYVTEIQERRGDRYGFFAPHLHFVFQGRKADKHGWAVSHQELRAAWLRTLRSYGVRPLHTKSVENLQVVRKSASAYLGKYLTKGRRVRRGLPEGSRGLPNLASWYGLTAGLRRRVKLLITVVTSGGACAAIASSLHRQCSVLYSDGYLAYWRCVEIPLGSSRPGEPPRFIKATVGRLRFDGTAFDWEGFYARCNELASISDSSTGVA